MNSINSTARGMASVVVYCVLLVFVCIRSAAEGASDNRNDQLFWDSVYSEIQEDVSGERFRMLKQRVIQKLSESPSFLVFLRRQLRYDPDGNVRFFSLICIKEALKEKAEDDLIVSLNDTESGIRIYACASVSNLKLEKAARYLPLCLLGEKPLEREIATKAIVAIMKRAALPYCYKLLEDPDSDVSGAASRGFYLYSTKEDAAFYLLKYLEKHAHDPRLTEKTKRILLILHRLYDEPLPRDDALSGEVPVWIKRLEDQLLTNDKKQDNSK
jgi:hypothetical protein